MKPRSIYRIFMLSLCGVMLVSFNAVNAEETSKKNYQQARWDPIHFKPAIDKATNEQCLACHQEILDRKTLKESPAGVKSSDALAWYQTLESYQGEQETFHRRHLETPLAKRLMKMKCTTCHQGNDLRDENPGSSADAQEGLTLRKMVDPNVCLMCHAQFNYKIMTGLPGPWPESREVFGNSCLSCHAAFRTNRHKVNFLNAEEIEKAGAESGDNCYGCHGGRAWYRIGFPYPRHEWPGMAKEIPDWAKDRPTESNPRFAATPSGDK